MLKRCNSLSEQIIKKRDNILSKIYKIKKIHINKQENSSNKLPKIKYFSQKDECNSLNNNIETTHSSNKIKNSRSNRIFIPVFESLRKKNEFKSEQSNKFEVFPLKIKKNNIFTLNLKRFSSEDSLIPKKIKSISTFHKRLMEENYISFRRKLNEDYIKLKKNETEKEGMNEMNFGKRLNNKLNTGIFGPSNNIISVIRTGIERLRLDNEYKGVDEDIKELIKDEIIDAQVKLKRKASSLTMKKREMTPLYKKKMAKYRYLTKMNLVREINQNSATPMIVNDGNLMLKLINKAFDDCKLKNNE